MLTIVLSLLVTGSAYAKDNTLHRLAKRFSTNMSGIVPSGEFTQKLDHFTDSDTQTFQQRYVIDSVYAKDQTSPVVFYVCGEGNCLSDEVGQEGDGWAWGLAQALGAHMVGLEHRFYGLSQPFPQLTADNLKYLSVEQAIEDLATFQEWVISSQGFSGKWVAIGGSYPADLAALYRLEHPELVSGAIASSACAIFSNGTTDADRVAAQTAGADCTAKFRANVLTPIVAAIGDETAMAPLKAKFNGTDIPDDLDFLGTVTGMAIFAIQEGGAEEFCAALNDPTDPLTAYANYMNNSLVAWGMPLVDWSYAGVASTDSTSYEGAIGLRQWMYQSCTEEGQFSGVVMKANPDTTASLSSSLTDALPAKYCSAYFGLTATPPIDALNAKYYQPLLDPSTSNILFVSGSNDPACFPFSISKENGNATNPNTSTYTVEGGSHCEDLEAPSSTDSASLQQARQLEVEMATQWTNP